MHRCCQVRSVWSHWKSRTRRIVEVERCVGGVLGHLYRRRLRRGFVRWFAGSALLRAVAVKASFSSKQRRSGLLLVAAVLRRGDRLSVARGWAKWDSRVAEQHADASGRAERITGGAKRCARLLRVKARTHCEVGFGIWRADCRRSREASMRSMQLSRALRRIRMNKVVFGY